MTEPTRVELELSPADVRLEAGLKVRTALAPVVVAAAPLVQHYTAFDIDPYLVVDGAPVDVPALGAVLDSQVGLGTFAYDEVRPAPQTVNTGAAARWLPDEASFDEAIGWQPTTGGEVAWVADVASSPYLDLDYTYSLDGAEIVRPALVFPGNTWLRLNVPGWTASAATFAVVAIMRAGTGSLSGPYYSVLESARPDSTEPDPTDISTDFGLRYAHGDVSMWAGSRVVSHEATQDLGRPMAFVLSLDPAQGRLGVLDRTKATRSFSLDNIRLFDIELFLGRAGSIADATHTAVMDVLEVDYFERGLAFEEIEALLATFDAMYGITA